MNGYMKPQDIEKRSFEIITAELGERTFPAGIAEVVKRVIHTPRRILTTRTASRFRRT